MNADEGVFALGAYQAIRLSRLPARARPERDMKMLTRVAGWRRNCLPAPPGPRTRGRPPVRPLDGRRGAALLHDAIMTARVASGSPAGGPPRSFAGGARGRWTCRASAAGGGSTSEPATRWAPAAFAREPLPPCRPSGRSRSARRSPFLSPTAPAATAHPTARRTTAASRRTTRATEGTPIR